MNRFETLLAPPSLSSKEFGIHLKMHTEVSPAVAALCRNELVNVGVRLHDELTTVRFGRTLDDSVAPEEYQEMNFTLTGALATPIEWRFFSREFDALHSAYPGLMSAGQLQRAITELSDPWRVQAWAAQALRIAQNAETEDPKNAASAWGCAVKLYRAFFARADVSQSFTYQQLTDAKAQVMCQAAWQAFLHEEVAALAQRAGDYAGRQQAASMAAVLAALAVPGVAAANPEAAARATAAAEESYLTGIRSATSLRAASTMYKIAPRKTAELDRALLEAMVSETKKLGQGFGEVEMVEECARSLRLDGGSLEGGSTLMRAAREEFYQAAVALSRTAINDDQATSKHRKLAIRVLAFVPRDYVAGKDPSGSAITVGNVLDMLKLAESPAPFTPRHDPPAVRTSYTPQGLPRTLALSRLEDLVDVLLGTRADSPQQVAAMDAVAEFMVQNPVLTPEDLVTTLDRRHTLHNTTKPTPPTIRAGNGALQIGIGARIVGWIIQISMLVGWGWLLGWLWGLSSWILVQIFLVVLGIVIPMILLGLLGRWAAERS